MANELSNHTRDTFRKHLQEIYGAKYIGELTTGWSAQGDDLPDIFEHPDSEKPPICVPQPSGQDGRYEKWIINRVINDNELKPVKMVYVAATGTSDNRAEDQKPKK